MNGDRSGQWMVVRASSGHDVAVARGDSGGAVYDPTSSGGALAKGTISAGEFFNHPASCGSVRPDVVTECSYQIMFKSHIAVLQRWDVHTITSDPGS